LLIPDANNARQEQPVSTIGTSLSSLLGSAQNTYAANATPSLAQILNEADNAGTSADLPTTNVTLSEQAKAYLAQADDSTSEPTTAALTKTARSWFDDQYKTLGISSAMIKGQVAVDLSGQSRATLSVVAANADGTFSKDEMAAASTALKSRFDTAMAPYAVIARHTGDYGSLYKAASDYMDQAGPAERATDAWKDQRQALVEGAAIAQKNFGKAPDTGNANDPIRALLSKTTASGTVDSGASSATVAGQARAMLDDQINGAKDKGTQLVFDRSRKTGQQVDFSAFNNRTLAAIAVNQDSKFSGEEVRAAKSELDQRTRKSILASFDPSSGSSASNSLALIKQYANMSAEEKSALGVTDDVMGRLAQNYRRMVSIQNTFSGGGTSLSSYL
jgi:hypothetical protein